MADKTEFDVTFDEAMEAAQEGYYIRRSSWGNPDFYLRSDTQVQLKGVEIIDGEEINPLPYPPIYLSDVTATNWEVYWFPHLSDKQKAA